MNTDDETWKWMEMEKEWMKYGWIMDDSGWNWINIDAEKKKGWKMDGNSMEMEI